MQLTATNPIRAGATDAADVASRIPQKTPTQDDFLKLVMAQMTSQDPLHPITDTQFIAQMAQFSALEQSKAMQADVATLRTEQAQARAVSLLGNTVELQGADGSTVTGAVAAVLTNNGTPQLIVNNQPFTLDQLVSVSQPSQNP